MKDEFERKIDYLRISVTDRCNLRCIYCMPEEGVPCASHDEILRYDEILQICRCLTELGITRIKLTGGEPLVRKNLPWLVGRLKNLSGIEKVTITTNGILLPQYIEDLKAAGLDGINISLDTLDEGQFLKITRRDMLEEVKRGIDAACRSQIPLKINCVPLGIPGQDLMKIASLAKSGKIHVRFIEMMPIGYGKNFIFLGEEEIVRQLEAAYGAVTPADVYLGNGPCHYYTVEGLKGKIGFISAISHRFCGSCNRIRLTSQGFLKACLQYETGCDLRALVRGDASDEEIRKAAEKVILKKPKGHRFLEKGIEEEESHSMAQIGG
ncbi:MAG: GTP 3',8-cyclase MoaA [Ruminococcus sp.]|jgi:cyclic pyranopterin phosphate synthase